MSVFLLVTVVEPTVAAPSSDEINHENYEASEENIDVKAANDMMCPPFC